MQSTLRLKEKVETNTVYFQLLVVFLHERPIRKLLIMDTFVQSAEIKLKCSLCNKLMKTAQTLKHHMLMHAGDKIHKCTLCRYSSTTVEALKRHKKTHAEEKPFHCNSCESSFSQLVNLQTHQRKHIEERLFSCDQCEKSFKDQISLKGHRISHHLHAVNVERNSRDREK